MESKLESTINNSKNEIKVRRCDDVMRENNELGIGSGEKWIEKSSKKREGK